MATLRNDTVVRSADGQGTSAIVTATNIGTYGVAVNSTYYVGTTQNIFNTIPICNTNDCTKVAGVLNAI